MADALPLPSAPRRGAGPPSWACIWYGLWAGAAIVIAARLQQPRARCRVIRIALPGGLLLMFLYWQVVPLMLATTGSSLDLRKLRAYPIPDGQLFSIEVLLRVTAGIEMVLVLIGITIGAMLNPALGQMEPAGGAGLCGVQPDHRRGAARYAGSAAGPQAHSRAGIFPADPGRGAPAIVAGAPRHGQPASCACWSRAIPGRDGPGPRRPT